jgi:tripartite-type tricarboxylate transporter receptor subunit TctC
MKVHGELGRRTLVTGLIGINVGAGVGRTIPAAQAQGSGARFPNQPIRLIVPYTAGGVTDVTARVMAQIAMRELGQPVVVDNRPGAAGTLGAVALAAGAAPDGYTLSLAPMPVYRQPYLVRVSYDPLESFTYVIGLTGYLYGVVVRADSPWKSWDDFVQDSKRRPGRLTYATTGIGSTQHITMEQVSEKAGTEWLHVPYRGSSETITALLGRQVDVVADASTWRPMVEDGQLRLLVTWGETRSPQYPNVPTFKEVGVDISATSPYGLIGPRGMAPDVVRVLHDAFRKALLDPEHLAAMDRFGAVPDYMSSADYLTWARATYAEQGVLLEKLGLRTQRN